jgi:hypothetical protein
MYMCKNLEVYLIFKKCKKNIGYSREYRGITLPPPLLADAFLEPRARAAMT